MLVHPLCGLAHLGFVRSYVYQVYESDADPLNPIPVGRADPPAGSSDDPVRTVIHPVEWQDYRGPLADEKTVALRALPCEFPPPVQFLLEDPWVDDHPIPEDEFAVLRGHSRGYLM